MTKLVRSLPKSVDLLFFLICVSQFIVINADGQNLSCPKGTCQPISSNNLNQASQPTCGHQFCYTVEPIEPQHGFLNGSTGQKETGVVIGPTGSKDTFVVNQIILVPRGPSDIRDLVAKYNAQVINDGTLPPPEKKMASFARPIKMSGFVLMKVDLSKVDLSEFSPTMEKLGFKGYFRFSSENALKLSMLLATEQLNGIKVRPNILTWPLEADCVLSKTSEISLRPPEISCSEGLVDLFQGDAFNYPFISGPAFNVHRAWQQIDLLHPPTTRVAIIDDGFDVSLPRDVPPSIWERPAPIRQFDYSSRAYNVQGPNLSPECDPPGALINPHCAWHGTYVWETISASMNNGLGSAGVASQVASTILLRDDHTWYSLSYLIDLAVSWGANTIIFSNGTTCGEWCDEYGRVPSSDSLAMAIETARENNVIVVTAAGNDNRSADEARVVPCIMSNVLCVGAVRYDNLLKSSFSNFGESVAIWAPGSFIALSVPSPHDFSFAHGVLLDGSGCLVTSPVDIFTGTSASAPYLGGVVAMMKAVNPDITFDEVHDILQSTASLSPDPLLTNGIVNAGAAVQIARERVGVSLPEDGNGTFDSAELVTLEALRDKCGTIIPGDNDYYKFNLGDYTWLTIYTTTDNSDKNGEVGGELMRGSVPFVSFSDGTYSESPFLFSALVPPRDTVLRMFGETSNTFNAYHIHPVATPAEIAPDRYDDENPTGERRNDDTANASWLRSVLPTGDTLGEVSAEELMSPLGAVVSNLNLDRGRSTTAEGVTSENDHDYFLLQLPDSSEIPSGNMEIATPGECLSQSDIDNLPSYYHYRPGRLKIRISPPHIQSHGWPDAFNIQVFDGLTWTPLTTPSGPTSPPLFEVNRTADGFEINCPHTGIPSGILGIRVESVDPAQRNFYNLAFEYRGWAGTYGFDLPPLDLLTTIELPEIIDVWGDPQLNLNDPMVGYPITLPSNPEAYIQCLNNNQQLTSEKIGAPNDVHKFQCSDHLTDYLIMALEKRTDLAAGIVFESACNLQISLLDGRKNVVAKSHNIDFPNESKRKAKGFYLPDLQKGTYGLEVKGSPCPYSLHVGSVDKIANANNELQEAQSRLENAQASSGQMTEKYQKAKSKFEKNQKARANAHDEEKKIYEASELTVNRAKAAVSRAKQKLQRVQKKAQNVDKIISIFQSELVQVDRISSSAPTSSPLPSSSPPQPSNSSSSPPSKQPLSSPTVFSAPSKKPSFTYPLKLPPVIRHPSSRFGH